MATTISQDCIFCTGTGLTKEHIFPRWLVDVLTPAVVGTEISVERTRQWADRAEQQRWTAPDVASATARVVCASCNSGWMSRLESRAKPLLRPMILGNPTTLDPAEQIALAGWTAMKAYVLEYAMGDVIVATPDERRALMDHGYPRGAAPVRLGAVERDGLPNSVRRVVYNVGSNGLQQGLAVCTTFTLGCAVLQVCHGLGIAIDWTTASRPNPDHLPLYPPCASAAWPPAQVLTAATLLDWERPLPAPAPEWLAQG